MAIDHRDATISSSNTKIESESNASPNTIERAASEAAKKVESIILYAFHELPRYQQDNHYILEGYRGELNSFKRCIGSLWYLHNESGTHLASPWLTLFSEYMVSFTWSSCVWTAGWSGIVYLFVTISYILTSRYTSLRMLFWRCCDVSWHEC